MPDMPNIIPLTDEAGNTTNYGVVAALEENGGKYLLLQELSEEASETAKLFILQFFTDENGEEYLTQIEDSDTYNKIMEIFKNKLSEGAKEKYGKLKQ